MAVKHVGVSMSRGYISYIILAFRNFKFCAAASQVYVLPWAKYVYEYEWIYVFINVRNEEYKNNII